MQNRILNPFITRGYAGPEYFCDRHSETQKVIEALSNGRNLALISPRRIGKTGLIQHVFHHLRKQDEDCRCFYIDIYSTQNLTDLVQLMGNTVLGSMETLTEKVMKQIATFFRSSRPVFSIDPYAGTPTLSFNILPQESQTSFNEIMEYLKASGRECYIAIDEFQQILEYPEKGTEALLRSIAQFAPNIHFIYAGSKQHMMSQIFSSPNKPFYQCTGRMGLQPISEEMYLEFAQRHMLQGGKTISAEVFHNIYSFAHGFTYYIQDILNRLYASDNKALDHSDVERILTDIGEEGEVVYKNYCDILPKGQLKLLRAIAADDLVVKPYEASFMKRHGMSAASSVRLALNALVNNNIVAKSDQGYFIYDRYLSLWFRS